MMSDKVDFSTPFSPLSFFHCFCAQKSIMMSDVADFPPPFPLPLFFAYPCSAVD
jgi:hypothetical protein